MSRASKTLRMDLMSLPRRSAARLNCITKVAAIFSALHRENKNAIKAVIGIVALSPGLMSNGAAAADYRVSEVRSEGAIDCLTYRMGWLFSTTGPCPDFKPPKQMGVGQSFSEHGTTHVIGVIVATQAEKDYQYRESLVRRGQWICFAAETPQDLGDRKRRRTWLYIPHCVPNLSST
jgi:hypothetical protein